MRFVRCFDRKKHITYRISDRPMIIGIADMNMVHILFASLAIRMTEPSSSFIA